MPDSMIIPSREAWNRLSKATRKVEGRDNTSIQFGKEAHTPPYSGITVQVTGPAVAIPTTTTSTTTTTSRTTRTTSTSTTTSTTTTTCLGASTTTPGANPATKYLYPGRIVYRYIDSVDDATWWLPGDVVWIQESNNGPLGYLCRYNAHAVGQYMGQTVMGVRGDGTAISCTSTTTTTTCACASFCTWDLTSGLWVLSSTGCDGTMGCDCPQPDFCPADAGCGVTFTLCAQGADSSVQLVNCTGTTTTTSSTSTTSTTTPDFLICGLGCAWKYVPGIGVVTIMEDCNNGTVLRGGWICGGCGGSPPGFTDPCTLVTAGCNAYPPPPPPPGCTGNCRWVWPGIDGMWWILLPGSSTCSAGNNMPCQCVIPSVAGSTCGQNTSTPCYTPIPPTTTGTGTTSTTQPTPTTTVGGCGDFCQLRWSTDLVDWVVIKDCGSSCGCAKPLFTGDDDCDVVEVPCVGTTTTTTTSTTSTTTSTTCASMCEYTCELDSMLYHWVLTTDTCSPPCFCPPPTPDLLFPCTSSTVDFTSIVACQPTSTTTSTTSTTSTTTSPGLPLTCTGCAWACVLDGYSVDPLTMLPSPIYNWAPCADNCTLGYVCLLILGESGCPDCNAVNAGTVCPGSCMPTGMDDIADYVAP